MSKSKLRKTLRETLIELLWCVINPGKCQDVSNEGPTKQTMKGKEDLHLTEVPNQHSEVRREGYLRVSLV